MEIERAENQALLRPCAEISGGECERGYGEIVGRTYRIQTEEIWRTDRIVDGEGVVLYAAAEHGQYIEITEIINRRRARARTVCRNSRILACRRR